MVIVNGYICMNCCDIDKARLGQDPQQSTDQLQKQLKRHIDRLDRQISVCGDLWRIAAGSVGR